MATTLPAVDPKHVFVNCPFDKKYKPLFDAIVFTVHDLGFQARHALIDDGEAVRLTRIAKELAGSKYSIHDLSRVEVGGALKVPRFNMPFEAGIAYCRHQFAGAGDEHHVLLLDSVQYRYQASLSDAAGLDPKVHNSDPELVVGNVRTFLVRKSGEGGPGAAYIWKRYGLFLARLPDAARSQHITMGELRSWDYAKDLQAMMAAWILSNPP
ncbi:hypothetical protein PLCT2_02979 [Planctomycetaceae bacterium]|nr:hypothetical protein PLCT2_02979 [Planctomycetaceae bacterium]